MSKKKYREFWVYPGRHKGEYSYEDPFYQTCLTEFPNDPYDSAKDKLIHVIEKSAYTDLQIKADKLAAERDEWKSFAAKHDKTGRMWKQKADKLAEVLKKVLKHVQLQKILISHTEVRKFVQQALAEYRGGGLNEN